MSIPLTVLPSVASTQDVVHAWGEEGRADGAVLAGSMSAGRGSRGRAWAAPAGGLWLSLLVRPADADGVGLLPLRAGLAVADVLEGLGGMPEVGLKWPNDLMVADRKLGGILCEARWRGEQLAWVAVGVGLNVGNPLPQGVRVPAARLADHLAPPPLEVLAGRIVEALQALGAAPATLRSHEMQSLERRDWLRGRQLVEPVAGVAAGITADGLLRVRAANGEILVQGGPVACAAAPVRHAEGA